MKYKTGATFNEDVIVEYIDRVLCPYAQLKGFKKLYFIFDSAKCHLTNKVKEHLELKNIEAIYVPPRLTNLLQPADVAWFGAIKNVYHQSWSNWFLYDDKLKTPAGNLRSPGYAKVIDWLSDIWSEFSKQILIDSFDSCGITSKNSLHSNLNFMLQSNRIISDYIRNQQEDDEFDSFEENDRHIFESSENIENDELPYESSDEDDGDFTQSDEDEIESGSDDDDNEIIANNNQNTHTKSAKNIQIENKENAKAKKKERRIETTRKILETANNNIKKQATKQKATKQQATKQQPTSNSSIIIKNYSLRSNSLR